MINDVSNNQQQAESVVDDFTEKPSQLGGGGGDFVLPVNRRPLLQWPIEQTGYQPQPFSYAPQNDEGAIISNTESYWPIPSDSSTGDLISNDDISPTQSPDNSQYQVQNINNPTSSQDPLATDIAPTLKVPRATFAARANLHTPRPSSTLPTTNPPVIQTQSTAPPVTAVIQGNLTNRAAPVAPAMPQPPPSASGVMRTSGKPYRMDSPAVRALGTSANIRQEPSSGAGMGYHGHKLVRGVNIGGFLVPEFWITPSLIADIPDPKPNDYLQLCKRLGPDDTLKLMRSHWDKWVAESEVQRLANAGITHLRIPLGHWEFIETDEGFVRGGLPYFKRLVYWANKYGMRVIPDMHTAPGSQNGFDNSGSTGGVNWTKDPHNVELSKRALQNMLRYIASDPVILATVDAIDLLNEPLIDQLNFGDLWDYDTGGHTLVTTGLHKIPPVISIIDRGFKDFTWWQPRWPRDWNSRYVDAWLDAHLYHVFDRNIDNWPLESHLRMVCDNGRDLKSNSTFFPIIVGEWSLALPQAALNGKENEARRRFAEAQLDAYDQGGAGWIFWCFKTESSPEWSFLESIDRSWLPQPLSSREFPQVCGH
ncbi:hypothetical protein LPJ81_005207, partial [Coemansia sp. IMI 209127]